MYWRHAKSVLRYEVVTSDSPLLKTLLQETYEEALQEIESQKQASALTE